MKIIETKIKDLVIIKPKVFKDDRGHFLETYNQTVFEKLGINFSDFHQDNQSMSKKGVLRGLHFQKGEHAQAKLVRVIKGSVLDVAVDLREGSPTYGEWKSVLLTGDNNVMFFIPEGFAHGFVTLEDDTIFSYKCNKPYNKESESGLLWNDPELNIDWMLYGDEPIMSGKDLILPNLKELNQNI